ncbi:unnamed protein product [Oppiella nova]|uniref:ABC transmembrane type-2 domain-containing protein n=1 Tax=Oppiella nova TaxID=334625 RepID=A0A7R9QVP8_9ACAR|nr:unnamed protein product [Oppiella nova]CAG2175709.1 unnamed protein product [Oppiella nova]
MIITETLTKALIDAELSFMRETMNTYLLINQDPLIKKQLRLYDPLVKFMDPPVYGSIDPNFRDFMAPGIIISVIYFMAVGLTALTLVVERKEGLMERSLVAGLKMHEILASQVLLQFFIVVLQATLLMIFTFLVFQVPNQGNIVYIILIVLLQGLGGMCFGLVISSVCKEENSAIMASLGSFYSYFLISGVIWPLEGMPPWLKTISYFMPQTLSIISLRNVMLKGWTIVYESVYLGLIKPRAGKIRINGKRVGHPVNKIPGIGVGFMPQVHNPPFLILDEPTVGTDPLLKEKIWEHLVVLSEMEGTTIIITTHYIEEARRAHIVALMRKGRLLVEHSPQFLLNYFCVQNLEEVFLRMCGKKVAEDMPENYYESRRMDFNENVFFSNKVLMDDEIRDQKMISSVTSMDRVLTQTHKNAIRVMRNIP